MPEPNISTCQDVGCGKFLPVGGEFVVQQVVELLWARPLVVFVPGVRLVEVALNGTSTQFRSLAPSLTRKAGTESPTVKDSRRYINLANDI